MCRLLAQAVTPERIRFNPSWQERSTCFGQHRMVNTPNCDSPQHSRQTLAAAADKEAKARIEKEMEEQAKRLAAEEKEIHKRFNRYRVRGEWFRLTEDFAQEIKHLVLQIFQLDKFQH